MTAGATFAARLLKIRFVSAGLPRLQSDTY